MVQIAEYEYDPLNYQLIKTTQYDNARPTNKYISQVKHVSNYLYTADCQAQFQTCDNACLNLNSGIGACRANCQTTLTTCNTIASSTPPTDPKSAALFYLRERHQMAVPVETQSLYQDAAGTKVLSSSLITFKRESNGIINPSESFGFNQFIDEASFTKSSIQNSGSFISDTRYRKLNTNDSYNTAGSLLQQTSAGGIQTNYTWDASNSFVTSTTVTGSVNTRTTSATYKPMVGPLTSTDANGRSSSQEYDVFNRPTITKDHDGNIRSRTRYHYKNETPGFRIEPYPNRLEGLVNESFTLSAVDIAASVGGTPQFVWDMGDGAVIDNNSTSVTKSYPSPGLYTVKLVGLNPEYGSVTRTIQLNINNPVAVSLSSSGTLNHDLCSSSIPPQVDVTAIITGGCPSQYSVEWRVNGVYKSTGGNLFSYSADPIIGTYNITCIVTDACGNSIASSGVSIHIYESNPNCAMN